MQGDSPKNLAPGVRLYTIDIGKSPPIPIQILRTVLMGTLDMQDTA